MTHATVLDANDVFKLTRVCPVLAGSPERAADDDRRKRALPTKNLLKSTGKKSKAKKSKKQTDKDL